MIRINIVGDFCVKDLDGLSIGHGIRDVLQQGDFNIINFESPLYNDQAKPIPKSGPNLYQDSLAPSFIINTGFNIISLANNHIMDYGEKGIDTTIKAFGKQHVIGAGNWSDAYKVSFFQKSNKRIGVLAVTQHEFGVLDDTSYSTKQYGTAWMLHPFIDEIIANAKQECDYLIIIPHAGLEHFSYPLPELRTLYRHWVDMGADAVIGGHPHVPQPWESYKNAPILYSLGNFCFDTLPNQNEFWNDGLIAQIDFTEKAPNLHIIPIHYSRKKRIIEISDNKKILDHLTEINNLYRNEDYYIKKVNNHCLSLQYLYELWFEQSGYIRPNIRKYAIQILKRLYQKINLNYKNKFPGEPMINNLRCEPHRWVLSRIYELKKEM